MKLHLLEAAFVETFVVPSKQHRWLSLLGSSKRRRDITSVLCHSLNDHVDRAKVLRIPKHVATDEFLVALLAKGANSQDCRVISDGPLDQRDLTIREAIEAQSGESSGTLVCVSPGSVCLWMPEPIADSLLLVDSDKTRTMLSGIVRRGRV